MFHLNNTQPISGGNMELSGNIADSHLKVASKKYIGSQDFNSYDELEKKMIKIAENIKLEKIQNFFSLICKIVLLISNSNEIQHFGPLNTLE